MASSSSTQERTISCRPKLYDAFISHRGPDVKDTLAKQLYDLLKARECRAFLDREEIEGGDSIPAAIRNGISSSVVQIAIFSKGYAQSSWCLDELVLMLEQIDRGALFIPVFYNVKPWELRYMENDNSQYAAAFSYYQSKGRNLDRLDAWKKALESAANISGYEHRQPQGDSRDLCEKVVSLVVQEMQKRIPLHVAKYPIALDELVQDFENSCPETSGLVGIFGLGGSGKTTLSKQLFNRKRERYGASSFLSDVRDSQTKDQLRSLQSQLLYDLFDDKKGVRNVIEGIARLKHRLGGAQVCKFLIVLDDIDRQNQLDALLPELESILSSGSLVIITTRDQSVLTAADVIFRYKMNVLDRKHSKELFCSHALCPRDSPASYEKLVECFIEYCGGLPLSLIVLGAHVRGRGEQFWKLELEKVKKIPSQEVMQRLKISFDGLEKEEKQIFIDIACFFNKQSFVNMPQRDFCMETYSPFDSSTLVIKALHKEMSCGEIQPMSIWKVSSWSAEHALETLQQKCLVEVIQDKYYTWRFEMHDHLRALGRQLADELGPPRLWKPAILRSMEKKGFKHILGNTKARCFNTFRDSSLNTTISYFTGSLNDSAEIELLWLEINNEFGRVLQTIPSWIPLQKLHYLAAYSMEGLWKSFQQQKQTNSQASFKLRRLHIRHCPSLQKLPELGQLERLNTLELHYCYDLETISELSSLERLQCLHVENCYALNNISNLSSLTELQSLRVQDCDSLKMISGISSLTELRSLHVQGCPNLETVISLSSLTELRSLHMQGYVREHFNCPLMLYEELNVASIRNLERIAILGCRHLQRVQGFEELRGLKSLAIEVPKDGYAWVKNCVYALRRLPSEYAYVIGNAVEKAMDRLNVDLFSQVIGGATITEMDTNVKTVHLSSSPSVITIYALLCDCGQIKVNAKLQTPYYYIFESSGSQAMITVILPQGSQFELKVECQKTKFGGRLMKGFKATVNEEEEGKALTLLQTLVDRLIRRKNGGGGAPARRGVARGY